LDRVADGAILASLTYWLFTTGNDRAAVAALLCLIAGQLVPYVRARAEGLGLIGETGVAHRFARLKIICVGALLGGFGVPYGLEIVLWFLAALSTVTVWQRVAFARRQLQEAPAEMR
jgi:CDP-diacylglycerol--glycerol-3-phosphate 3-phosphatidyltransferase